MDDTNGDVLGVGTTFSFWVFTGDGGESVTVSACIAEAADAGDAGSDLVETLRFGVVFCLGGGGL